MDDLAEFIEEDLKRRFNDKFAREMCCDHCEMLWPFSSHELGCPRAKDNVTSENTK